MALKSNLLQLLLNQLSLAGQMNSIKDSNSTNLISKLIFTLSGLLKKFPHAQSEFIRFGGIEILDKILSIEQFSSKLKAKILTLVSDLLLEKVKLKKK